MIKQLAMQLQPNQWSCLPAAFAMVMETTTADVIEAIGHDGSEILWPDLREPLNRRAFHVQECIDVCLARLVPVIGIDANPIGIYDIDGEHDKPIYEDAEARLVDYLQKYVGVLTGCTEVGSFHSVAWDGDVCWCPSGHRHPLGEFIIETFWVML